jgi:hypothetical protein
LSESRYPHLFTRLLTISLSHLMECHCFDWVQVRVVFYHFVLAYTDLRDYRYLLTMGRCSSVANWEEDLGYIDAPAAFALVNAFILWYWAFSTCVARFPTAKAFLGAQGDRAWC